jgi:hypothetical protein
MKGITMFKPRTAELAAFLLLSAVLLPVLSGCTKRIDTSSEDKYYKSMTEVMSSLPASKQREFDDGIFMIWFYAESDEAANALLHKKSGEEVLALVEEMKAALPKLDTSSKEAYESSLQKMKAALPAYQISDFDEWLKKMPAYRKGNPRIESLNGLPFHMIVERAGSGGSRDSRTQQNQ